MTNEHRPKLSDAVKDPHWPDAGTPSAEGKPEPGPDTVAEQTRKAQHDEEARQAVETTRERMVEIGRAQQVGRQGSS